MFRFRSLIAVLSTVVLLTPASSFAVDKPASPPNQDNPTPGTNLNASSQASAGTASVVSSTVLQSSGPSIPSLDPAVVSTLSWAHQTTPESDRRSWRWERPRFTT
jgi:hypothetical protein